MADMQALLKEYEERMKKTIAATSQELAGLRTGRASTALVDNIKVEMYGSFMPLKQLANFSVPEARTIEIRAYDKASCAAIEKAISASDLKLTPNRNGDVIRLILPPLNEERREELVKIARKQTEDGRVSVRNLRHELNNKLKSAKEKGEMSEDELKKLNAQSQKLTDLHIAKLDENLAGKEKEIRTV